MADYSLAYTAEEIDQRLGMAGAHASRHSTHGEDALAPESIGAAKISVKHSSSLLGLNWNENIYQLNVPGATASNIIELLIDPSITLEQLEALQAANIVGVGQDVDTVTLKAFGEIPTLDIPITIIVRGDL